MKKTTSKQINLVEALRKLDQEMSVQTYYMLLLIRKHQPISMPNLVPLSGMSQASVSRNVNALGDRPLRQKAGLGVVQLTHDPVDPRRKIVKLTAKGERFMTMLDDILEKEQ